MNRPLPQTRSTEPAADQAVSQWQSRLGPHRVLVQPADLAAYNANVSALDRTVTAVLKPGCTEEVLDLVKIANAHRAPLYPVSTGRNWGLGSKLPAKDGAAIVDLSAMNRIREVNAEYHYAVVEPGVTQQQLYEYLLDNELPLLINVIGSSKDTSLIGNALERGIGYFDSRAASLSCLEVVLGNGQLLRTGFSHIPDNLMANLYRHGVGPELDGLFAQSNYGIVTAATVDLMPKPQAQVAMIASIDDDTKLPALINALAELRRNRSIQTISHIGNRPRCDSTLAPLVAEELLKTERLTPEDAKRIAVELLEKCGFKAWSAVAGLLGTRRQMRVAKKEIAQRLHGIARPIFLTETHVHWLMKAVNTLAFLPFFRRRAAFVKAQLPLFGLTTGVPSDIALRSVHWGADTYDEHGDAPDLDNTHSGYLLYLPFTPLSGEHAEQAMRIIDRICGKHDFVPYVTMNIVNTRALEHVLNISFDRRAPEAVERAHACFDELDQEFRQHGYLPYRLGIQQMPAAIDKEDPFWQTARDLKNVLDPNRIIAPGRYNLV